MNENNFLERIGLIITALMAVLVAMFAFTYLTSRFSPQPDTNSKIQDVQDQIEQLKQQIATSDYDRKELLHKTTVISQFANSAKNGEPTDVATKNLIVEGKIAYGYLYVRASVNGDKLSKSDSIYMKLTSKIDNKYQELGGHLRRDKSLTVPSNASSTELLYSLDNVYYKVGVPYNENLNALSSDFIKAINNGTNQKTYSFVSTLRQGLIEDISIYYACDAGEECSIAAEK